MEKQEFSNQVKPIARQVATAVNMNDGICPRRIERQQSIHIRFEAFAQSPDVGHSRALMVSSRILFLIIALKDLKIRREVSSLSRYASL